MRSSLVFTVLLAQLASYAAADRGDRYYFYLSEPVDCNGRNNCTPCGSGGCIRRYECGTWGGQANTCCRAINLSLPGGSTTCSPFKKVIENFNFASDGTAVVGTKKSEFCPNQSQSINVDDYKIEDASACCPITQNFVIKKNFDDETFDTARCIPDPTPEGPLPSPDASGSSGSSPTSGGTAATSSAGSASSTGGTPASSTGGTSSASADGANSSPNAASRAQNALALAPVMLLALIGF